MPKAPLCPDDQPPDDSDPSPQLEFPSTLWTQVFAAAQGNREQFQDAMGRLLQRYRPVIATYFRVKCKNPLEAEDLVGSFILYQLEKNRLAKLERRETTRFRNYLSRTFKNFWIDYVRARKDPPMSLDQMQEDQGFELSTSTEADVQQHVDQALASAVHGRAIDALREGLSTEEKLKRFERLEPFLLSEPDYQKAADGLGLKPNALRQAVFRLRNDYFVAFRSEVLQMVENRQDLDEEVRYLISLLPYITRPTPPEKEQPSGNDPL